VALFAISYDAVEVLEGFATEHRIGFPLLSDAGSVVIRRLGLLNECVQDDHAAYGIAPNPRHLGVPYPGTFVLDERGVVARKRFHASYRERDTGPGLIAGLLELPEKNDGAAAEWRTEGLSIRASLDSPTYRWFQRLRLDLAVTLAEGAQVHGRPAAEGSVPLSVEVAPVEGLEVETVEWPPPLRLVEPGAPPGCWVYEGTVHTSLSLTFTAPPGGGDRVVQVAVTYQRHDHARRPGPSTVRLELPVQEVALIGRTLPRNP
jgi:hypothetical protein